MATLNHPRNYPFTPNSTLKPPTPTSTSQHPPSPSQTIKSLPLQSPSFPSISLKNNPIFIDDSDLVVYESSKKVKTGPDAPNMFTGTSSSKAVTRKDSISLKSFSQERPEKYTSSMTVEAPNVLTEGAQKKNRAPPSNAGPSDGDHDSKQKDGRYNLRRRNKDDSLTVEDTLFKNSQVMQAHRVNGSSKDEEEDDVSIKQQLSVIVKEYKASGPLSRSEVRRQGLWSNNRHAPMLEFLTQELPYSQQLKNFKPQPVKKEVKPKVKPHAKTNSEMKYEVIELDSEPIKLETIVLDEQPIVPVFPSTPSVKTSTDACEFPQPIDIESISVKHESGNEPELIMDPVDPMIVVSISTQRGGFFNQNEFREKAQLWKDLRRINNINLNRNIGPKKQKLTVKESKRFFLSGGNLYDEVRVGSQFQATTLPIYKPDSDKKVRIVKSVWRPDSVPRESLEKFFEFLEKESQLEITNEQAKIKMLRDFGLDVDRTIEYLRNNKVSFRRLFRTERKKSAMFNE